jgi:small nuclear ribonucleoprotein
LQVKVDNPLKNLRMGMNRVVMVKLKDGTEFVGRLEQSDGTMNLILKDCTEIKEGTSDPVARYDQVLIRGSNILFISLDYENLMNKESQKA